MHFLAWLTKQTYLLNVTAMKESRMKRLRSLAQLRKEHQRNKKPQRADAKIKKKKTKNEKKLQPVWRNEWEIKEWKGMKSHSHTHAQPCSRFKGLTWLKPKRIMHLLDKKKKQKPCCALFKTNYLEFQLTLASRMYRPPIILTCSMCWCLSITLVYMP